MELLFELAETKSLKKKFSSMLKGEKVNSTENRAALHTALRNFSDDPVYVDGKDVMQDIKRVRDEIKAFSTKVHKGEIRGSTGKIFRHIVVIGIGGSYLGTQFVSTALEAVAKQNINIHYLSNVDINEFGYIESVTDPETTLWIVISKSYTTYETIANEICARSFVQEKGLDPAKHFAVVTSRKN